MLCEDQTNGQLILSYTVEYTNMTGGTWLSFANGTSMGNKRIHLLPNGPMRVVQLRLTIKSSAGNYVITHFGAYAQCPSS